MSVKLTHSQVECLRLIRRGVTTSPPLLYKNVLALIRKGCIVEVVSKGVVSYILTPKGREFL